MDHNMDINAACWCRNSITPCAHALCDNARMRRAIIMYHH